MEWYRKLLKETHLGENIANGHLYMIPPEGGTDLILDSKRITSLSESFLFMLASSDIDRS